jgi:hypothetical protein
MLRSWAHPIGGLILGMFGAMAPEVALDAQEHLTVRADLVLYGDNTEFRNPFREGETIFGAAVRPALDIAVNTRVTVSLGALTNVRFGSDDAFDLVRPVVSVTVRGSRSTFLMGSLPWPRSNLPDGPDREGPHGLLPPLQRETLTFERPYEAGLQWTFGTRAWQHETWINWQRLNTAEHRERFDAGLTGRARASGALSVPFQLHVVHEGGQLFSSGAVADSLAAAAGLAVSRRVGHLVQLSLEAYAVVGRHVPDRQAPLRSRNGAGFFGRASAARNGWRGHLVFWRGDDFIKDEGDANYLSQRRDGSRYRGIRDYAETGLTRTFDAGSGIRFEASGRLHRVERYYEYSYRILCVARLGWRMPPGSSAVRAAAAAAAAR